MGMKTAVPRVKTVHGPVAIIMADGSRWTYERTITRVDDIRKTPFGSINFGKVYMSPDRLVQVGASR